jgi:cell division septum initiation protein DivIVA
VEIISTLHTVIQGTVILVLLQSKHLASIRSQGSDHAVGRINMAIEIDRLSELLLKMADQNAPGHEFSAAIAELARTGRFSQLKDVLPSVVYDELWQRYESDPVAFVGQWEHLAHEMQQGFSQHARQRLTSLTRLQQAGNANTPAWKSIQRALDGSQNDLLRAAVAAEFLDLVEPAVARATHLRECVVASPSSEEADRYLDEATRCYFFALFTACAVMCRSVLEEAIKQKLPESLSKLIRSRYRNTATLGNLLHEINNNLLATGIDSAFPRIANQVNDIGKKAVHQGLLSEDEARSCLQNAREALQMLLQK